MLQLGLAIRNLVILFRQHILLTLACKFFFHLHNIRLTTCDTRLQNALNVNYSSCAQKACKK